MAQSVSTAFPGDQRSESGGQGDAGGGTVLRHCAFRNMDMKIMIFEYPALFRIERFDQGQRDLNRLFHDVAQLAGDQKLSLPLGSAGFQYTGSRRGPRPRKSGDDTGSFDCKLPVVMHLLCPR